MALTILDDLKVELGDPGAKLICDNQASLSMPRIQCNMVDQNMLKFIDTSSVSN